MNFKKGDQVVHRNFGVGRVAAIEGMDLSGNHPRLFYRVEFTKTTVWVPVGHQPSGGLRPITPKSELNTFRALLKSSPTERNKDYRARKSDLENRFDGGTFQALCEVFRDLYAWNWLNPLNNYEKSLLSQTRDTLAAEWSATSGLSVNEALEEIYGYLSHSNQNATSR